MSYDPEKYLESTSREIKRYVEANINTGIYRVVMEFPGSIVDAEKVPLNKTIIHFEIDGDDKTLLGFGDNVFDTNYDAATHLNSPQAAERHVLNFDVGIWSSDRSGGTTARMRAKQLLAAMFAVDRVAAFRSFTDGGDGGIEILNFSGGRFALDVSANDIRLYRMVDCALTVRVFSRTPLATVNPEPAIESIVQSPGLTILG